MTLPGCDLLGSSPLKDILQFYAEDREETPLQLYAEVLKETLGLKTSLQQTSLLQEDNLVRFYGAYEEDPQYLSVRNHAALSRLQSTLGRTFVILQYTGPQCTPIKIFDTRVRILLTHPEEAVGATCDVFCLKRRGSGFELYLVHNVEQLCNGQGLDPTEGFYIQSGRLDPDCCLKKLAILLEADNVLLRVPETLPRIDGARDWTLYDLCMRPAEVLTHLGQWPWADGPKPIVLIYHLGTLPVFSVKKANSIRLQPKRQTFRIVATFWDAPGRGHGRKRFPWKDSIMVGVTGHGRLYTLKEAYRQHVLKEKLLCSKSGKTSSALPRDITHSEEQQEEEEDGEERLEEVGVEEELNRDKAFSACGCLSCREGEKWVENLGPKGPQVLNRIPFDALYYLKLLGLDTAEHRAAILECCRLSCCALDIESTTHNFEEEGEARSARRDPQFEFLSTAPRSASSGNDAVALQTPIYLGHLDRLTSEPVHFAVEGGLRGVRPAVERYLLHLMRLQENLAQKKKELLAPLYQVVKRYKKAHFDYFVDWIREQHRIQAEEAEAAAAMTDSGESGSDDPDYVPGADIDVDTSPPYGSEGGQAAVEQEEESEEEEDEEEQVQEEGSETAEQEEKEEWNMAACWERSFLGLFERELDKLAQNLNIFTFNGAHYDMVLLANYVASANGKFGRSYYRDWKILKNGSSVVMLDLPSRHLHFRGE